MSDGMASVALDAASAAAQFVLGAEPGAIVAGFDVHRRQITFDAVDTVTGEVWRGQIESSSPAVEEWVGRFPCVPSFRPAPGAIEAPAPGWRPTKDRAAGVTPQERPINHLVTGSRAWQPRAQIRQGVQEQPEPNPDQPTG